MDITNNIADNSINYSSEFLIFVLLLIILIYILQAIFLSRFNKLVNGHGTAMGFVPIANIYLLGKLTFNRIIGWILVVLMLLTGTLTITINGVESHYRLLPKDISVIVSRLLMILIIVLFIYAIVKYIKMKRKKHNENQNNNE